MPGARRIDSGDDRNGTRHVRSLDGLRGLAVLGVCGSHMFRANYTGYGAAVWMAGKVLGFGAKGVDLFFVLSGFLITGILFDSLQDRGYFRKFYARRCLRIFPLYYGVLFLLFGLTPLLGIHWNHVQWTLLFYVQNTSLATPVWDFQMPYGLNLGHFWSLAVEEQFYLVWPMAVFLIRDRRRLLAVCVGVSGLSLLLRLYLYLHHTPVLLITSGTLTRADALLCGGALALLTRGPVKTSVLASGRTVTWMAAGGLVMLAAAGSVLKLGARGEVRFAAVSLTLELTLWALMSGGLIAWSLLPGSAACRVFENGVLRWFGKYSYGLYVLHLVALEPMLSVFRGWLDHVTSHRVVVVGASGLMVFGVSVAAAYLSFNLYERRFLSLKRFFEYERPERIPR